MNIKRNLLATVAFLIAFSFVAVSCKKSRISYTDMIKRENTEINDFFNQEGILVQNSFPEGLVTPEKHFVKVEEGVFVRVLDAGSTPLAVSGETKISARFKLRSLAPSRYKMEYDNVSPLSGGTDPLRFIYNSKREVLTPDPQASENEVLNNRFLCAAFNILLKHVGDGAVVEMVTSFREGPSFTAEEGIALYFERIELRFVHK